MWDAQADLSLHWAHMQSRRECCARLKYRYSTLIQNYSVIRTWYMVHTQNMVRSAFVALSDARLTGDQEVAGSITAGSGNNHS